MGRKERRRGKSLSFDAARKGGRPALTAGFFVKKKHQRRRGEFHRHGLKQKRRGFRMLSSPSTRQKVIATLQVGFPAKNGRKRKRKKRFSPPHLILRKEKRKKNRLSPLFPS